MNEEQVMHAMSIDDAYKIERVLAHSNLGTTEVVSFDGVGPFVRKKIPLSLANRKVWAVLAECSSMRLPKIVATYEMPDQFIVVYDYVPGDTLEHVVAGAGHLELEDSISIVKEITEALLDLHHHGIIHCDISPSNVIIAADGAHLIDFGIAQQIGAASSQTHNPSNFGTWGFAAPEQYGFASADVRSDLYSIVRLMGYIITGYLPDQKQYEQLLFNSNYFPQIIQDFIKKGTSFDTSARFQNCNELLIALNDVKLSLDNFDQNNSCLIQYAPKNASNRDDHTVEHPIINGPFEKRIDSTIGNDASQTNIAITQKAFSKKKFLITGVCLFVVAILLIVVGTVLVSNQTPSNDESSNEAPSESSIDSELDNLSQSGNIASDTHVSVSPEELNSILSVTESGWTTDEYGVVYFGAGLQNTSETYGVVSPAVSIVGKASDGSVIFSEDQPMMYIQPGETVHYGTTVGDGSSVPDLVEVTAVVPDSYNLVKDDPRENAIFRIDNVSDYAVSGGYKFTGEVSLEQGIYPEEGLFGVLVTVILRDDEGNIVYGNSIEVNTPTNNTSVPFALSCYSVPDFSTFELYAQVW